MTHDETGLNAAVADVLAGEQRASRLTQGELADRSGIGERSLQRYLAGERPISVTTLDALAKVLGILPEAVLAAARERIERAPIDPNAAALIAAREAASEKRLARNPNRDAG